MELCVKLQNYKVINEITRAWTSEIFLPVTTTILPSPIMPHVIAGCIYQVLLDHKNSIIPPSPEIAGKQYFCIIITSSLLRPLPLPLRTWMWFDFFPSRNNFLDLREFLQRDVEIPQQVFSFFGGERAKGNEYSWLAILA